MDDEKTLWHETTKALAVFNEYCLLGPSRSLAKLTEKLGKPSGYTRQLETWSSNFKWAERARDYDKAQFEEKQRKHNAEIEAMNERHATLGYEQQLIAIKQIQTLINARSFGSVAAVQLLKLALDIERIARGMPTEQKALTGKDGGPLEVDVVVETHWGRGTDPRKQSEDDAPQEIQSDEDESEISVEFGAEE